jgi:hypothetical protein
VARHGRGTSSDATGDTRFDKLGHDAQNHKSRLRLTVVAKGDARCDVAK